VLHNVLQFVRVGNDTTSWVKACGVPYVNEITVVCTAGKVPVTNVGGHYRRCRRGELPTTKIRTDVVYQKVIVCDSEVAVLLGSQSEFIVDLFAEGS
jgi:hypothetical protein